jgi:dTDP-4-amino-4,6-dideoxygalactose transaminase
MGGSESQYVGEAFQSNFIAPLGPMVNKFEAEFSKISGLPFCLAVSSGTAAMHLALRCLSNRSSTEVDNRKPVIIASSLTFIGSISPACFEGIDLVFLDSSYGSWNMDTDLLLAELEWRKSRDVLPIAVIPTDLYGEPSNLPKIREICLQFQIPLISDSAEAVGAHYFDGKGNMRHAGFDSDAAVFSFNGNKIITTSGGGMLGSHDEVFINHARKLATQAREEFPWYEHAEIGYNYRMSNIVAAIGVGQLEVLEDRVNRRRAINAMYHDILSPIEGVSFLEEPGYAIGNQWLTVVFIDPATFGVDNNFVREVLETNNIESRPVWKPMHMQPVFRSMVARYQAERVRKYDVCEEYFSKGLCLPSGSALSDSDVERICSIIISCRNRKV